MGYSANFAFLNGHKIALLIHLNLLIMKTMKSIPLLLTVLFISACASQNEFTKKVDDLLTSKRYKDALAERDELCNAYVKLKADTIRLYNGVQELKKTLEEAEQRYNSLSNTSDKKLAQLTADLQTKSRELSNKEKLLQEREVRLKELQQIVNRQDSIVQALNNKVKDALLGFQSDELKVELKNGKVYVSLSDKLLFKSGSAKVEEKGQDAIKLLADVLNKNPDIDIAVEGHTDNVPIKTSQYKDNWDLSVARATNIVRLLTEEYKVNPRRLTSSGKGEYFPVAENTTPEGRARNRRTEIILSPKLDELFNILQTKK